MDLVTGWKCVHQPPKPKANPAPPSPHIISQPLLEADRTCVWMFVYVLTDRLMSCSQPWVLWQPCVGRWVLCVRTTKLVVSSQSQKKKKKTPPKASHLFVSAPPASSIPTECVFVHPTLSCACCFSSSAHPLFDSSDSFPFDGKNAKALLLFLFFLARLPSQLRKPRRVPLWMGGTSRWQSSSWFCCCRCCSAELTSTWRGELCERSDYQPDLRDWLWRAVFGYQLQEKT